MTIRTREREPRDVIVDTSEFSDISLAYAVHVHKAQGLTADSSGILTGGWQTDREHTYVAVSRAREQTHIYIAREDLGEQGMDTGAIERLGEKMRRQGAQEATIVKELAKQAEPPEREPKPEPPAPLDRATLEEQQREREREIEEILRRQRARQPEQTTQLKPDGQETVATDRQAQDIGRDPYIEQAIQDARERQEAWERGVGAERDNDRDMGHGIE